MTSIILIYQITEQVPVGNLIIAIGALVGMLMPIIFSLITLILKRPEEKFKVKSK